MMKQILCDICSENEGQTLMLQSGHKMGMEDSKYSKYEYIDICLPCLIEQIQSLLENLPLEVNQTFTDILKNRNGNIIEIKKRRNK